jgi:hypothetical protein
VASIRWEQRLIDLPPSDKGDERRIVPMCDVLVEALAPVSEASVQFAGTKCRSGEIEQIVVKVKPLTHLSAGSTMRFATRTEATAPRLRRTLQSCAEQAESAGRLRRRRAELIKMIDGPARVSTRL